jgi:hypothetical protein
VFRCLAYALKPAKTHKKLDPNSTPTVFVGYEETTRQYRVYDPAKGKLIRSSNVLFYEDKRLDYKWGEQLQGEPDSPIDLDQGPESASEPEAGPRPSTPASAPTSLEPRTELNDSLPLELVLPPLDPGTGQAAESELDPNATPIVESKGEDSALKPQRGSRTQVQTVPFDQRYQAQSAIAKPLIPRTYQQAITDPLYRTHWRGAIKDELDKLQGINA